ncbi:unnamed protein product [Caenorhabditis brenneri]
MGVPILRLPFLALKVLVDYLNNLELVTVSSLSKRTDRILKACGKKNVSFFKLEESEIKSFCDFNKYVFFYRNPIFQVSFSFIFAFLLLECRRQRKLPRWDFKLCCYVGNELRISISFLGFNVSIYLENLEIIESFEGINRNLKIGESLVPFVIVPKSWFTGPEKIHIFWSNKTHGMISSIDYFKDILNLSNIELVLEGGDSTTLRTIVNHINSTQTVVRNVEVGVDPQLSDDDFNFILKNVSASKKLYSKSKLSRNFKFNGSIRAKIIKIRNAHWFTLKNLLTSNENEEISVDGSNLKTEDLRKFLREWKSGKFPKLKKVELETKVSCMSYLDVTSGLEKRKDKCDYSSRRRPVIAIKGQGDVYGIVDPDENFGGYFRMSVHNHRIRGHQ